MALVVAVRIKTLERNIEIRRSVFILQIGKLIRGLRMKEVVIRGKDGLRQYTGTNDGLAI